MASNVSLKRRSQRAAEESAAFGPIAERFRRAGDLDRAVALCREGLQKFPNTISARVTLGWALLDQGKYDEARTELEKALRRAPDNLAAIRGLAELHDRAEHTLNLPMDGPGQWPPDEEAVDQAVGASPSHETEAAAQVSHEALATAVQFTADRNSVEAEAEAEAEPERVAVFTNNAGQERAVAAEPVAEPVAEPEPFFAQAPEPEAVAEAVAEPVAEAYEEPVAEEAVVEQAAVPTTPVQPAAVAEAAEVAEAAGIETGAVETEEIGVSEADIAALIAEADKLEAAAAAVEVEVEEPAAFEAEVTGDIELVATEEVTEATYGYEAGDAIAGEAAEAVAHEVTEEVAAVAEVVAEPVAEVIAEPVETIAEEVTEAVAHEVAEDVAAAAELVAEPVAEAAVEIEAVAEVAAEAVAEPVAEVLPEPVAEVAEAPVEVVAEAAPEPIAEPVAEVRPEPVPVAAFKRVEPPAVVPQPVVGFDPITLPTGETLEQPMVAAAIVDVTHRMHLAEIAPLARAARAESGGNKLVALERLLVKVQARRRELMRQSVA